MHYHYKTTLNEWSDVRLRTVMREAHNDVYGASLAFCTLFYERFVRRSVKASEPWIIERSAWTKFLGERCELSALMRRANQFVRTPYAIRRTTQQGGYTLNSVRIGRSHCYARSLNNPLILVNERLSYSVDVFNGDLTALLKWRMPVSSHLNG
jgi:hypothetical protein